MRRTIRGVAAWGMFTIGIGLLAAGAGAVLRHPPSGEVSELAPSMARAVEDVRGLADRPVAVSLETDGMPAVRASVRDEAGWLQGAVIGIYDGKPSLSLFGDVIAAGFGLKVLTPDSGEIFDAMFSHRVDGGVAIDVQGLRGYCLVIMDGGDTFAKAFPDGGHRAFLAYHEGGHCLDYEERDGAGGNILAAEVYADVFGAKATELAGFPVVADEFLRLRAPIFDNLLTDHSTSRWVAPYMGRKASSLEDARAMAREARDACLADQECRETVDFSPS